MQLMLVCVIYFHILDPLHTPPPRALPSAQLLAARDERVVALERALEGRATEHAALLQTHADRLLAAQVPPHPLGR